MDILDRTLKKLDPEDSAGSFSEIENYLARVMETIDFTLSKQQTELSNVDPERMLKLERAFAVLSQDVSSLKRSLNGLEKRITAAEELIQSHATELQDHERRIQSHAAELQDHENRIQALENNA